MILRHILEHRSSSTPEALAQELSLLIADEGSDAVRSWCIDAIEALPAEAQRVRDGNERVINRLLGHVMKTSRGRANPETTKTMLLGLLRASS